MDYEYIENSNVKKEVQHDNVERNSVKKTRHERNKEYYGNHKLSYYSLPEQCECGCFITKVHLNRHRQTIKHLTLMSLYN